MTIHHQTARRQEIGRQLRVLRTTAGWTLEDAGEVIHCHGSKISRLETGHRSAPIEDLAGLLAYYRADQAQRDHLFSLARATDDTGWIQSKHPAAAHGQLTLNTVSTGAEEIVVFDPVAIPRLLQTSDYRTAILAESATSRENDHYAAPKRLHAIVDESVLHRPFGGQQVLRDQLHHLQGAAAKGDCTIRVLPRNQTITTGAFTLLRVPDRPPVIVLEHLTCRLFLEQPHDSETYEHALKQLDTQAFDETESLELISNVAEGLEQASRGL